MFAFSKIFISIYKTITFIIDPLKVRFVLWALLYKASTISFSQLMVQFVCDKDSPVRPNSSWRGRANAQKTLGYRTLFCPEVDVGVCVDKGCVKREAALPVSCCISLFPFLAAFFLAGNVAGGAGGEGAGGGCWDMLGVWSALFIRGRFSFRWWNRVILVSHHLNTAIMAPANRKLSLIRNIIIGNKFEYPWHMIMYCNHFYVFLFTNIIKNTYINEIKNLL